MTDGPGHEVPKRPKGAFDKQGEDLPVSNKDPDKEEALAAQPDDGAKEIESELDSVGKVKALSKGLNQLILHLGYAWDMKNLGYLRDRGKEALGEGKVKVKKTAASAKVVGDEIKSKAKEVKRGTQGVQGKTKRYWGCLVPLVPFACAACWLIGSLGREAIELIKAGPLARPGESVSLAERLYFSVNNEEGTLNEFEEGLIDLDFLDPWEDESMKDVVAGGGALAPFVEKRKAYIDRVFGEDVRTEDMTKEYLEELLWRAEKNGLMEERDVLFYLLRFQYGDDAEGFYNLLEENPDIERLRKLQIGGNTSAFGNTGLSKGGVVLGQREQKEAMRVMARQARRQGWG